MRVLIAGLALVAAMTGAPAYEFEPAKALDTREIEPAMLNDVYGAWEIRDRSGKRRCRFTLLKEFGIGGYQIEVAPNCKQSFPVMDDIAAWQLLEGWSIDLIDPLRKTRIRFTTPDNRYVAFGDEKDIAGIDELRKLNDKTRAKR